MYNRLKATEEQIAYAKILDVGMKIGLITSIILFCIYISGVLAPYIPVKDLPKYWGMSVHEYLEATGIQSGWSWVRLLQKGDFLNFIGIVFLAGLTIACYIRIIPIFKRKKDKVYMVLAVLEVLVLALAASGILRAGGH